VDHSILFFCIIFSVLPAALRTLWDQKSSPVFFCLPAMLSAWLMQAGQNNYSQPIVDVFDNCVKIQVSGCPTVYFAWSKSEKSSLT
jgi:hypothetical protein